MDTVTTRFTLAVPADLTRRVEALKKDVFYDKPYAEMYRQLIRLGIEKSQEKMVSESGCRRGNRGGVLPKIIPAVKN